MFSRPGAKVGVVALVLLATTLLLPLAASDHAYSHRYVFYGRVVDAEGNPVPGLTVRLGFRDIVTEGNCANQPNTDTAGFGRTETRPVTNQLGEFMFCAHAHSMSRSVPGTAILTIPEANNFTHEEEMDPYYRVSFVTLRLPEVRPEANKTALDTTYTVAGRLWSEGNARTHVESIRVFGTTRDNVPVNVTLDIGGQTQTLNTTTNGYGDFSLRFPVTARPTSGTVTVEVAGETYRHDVTPQGGLTAIKQEVPAESTGISGNTVWAIVGILAALAILVGAVVVFRRMAAKREEQSIRANAQRKRANK